MPIVTKPTNTAVVAAVGFMLISASAIAEKIDCSNSRKSKQEISNQIIEPGDRPDHRMRQYVRLDVVSSKHPDWDGAESRVYGHTDTIGGSGTHRGYVVNTLTTGEKVWARWEGTEYLVPKGGGTWEVTFQGIFRFIAGTGKYKAIRGGGYYRGMATPDGLTQDAVCDAEY